VYFFIMSAISALGLYLGGVLIGTDVYLANIWLPLAGVTIAFAMSNPEQQILLFLVIPMKLKYLALLDVAFVFIGYAQSHLILGIFALCGCAATYWYVRSGGQILGLGAVGRRNYGKVLRIHVHERGDKPWKSWNPIRWYRERRRRKQIEDLFKRSGFGN